MGMTIDDHIEQLKQMPISSEVSVEYLTCIYETIDAAIDIMRKYQKIEQILKSLDDGEINYPQMTYYLREVLEDGDGR